MKVTCDRCGKEFHNFLKEDTKQIEGNEITHTYLQCPYCETKYSVCFDDTSTIVLKKQIRKHVALLNTIKDPKQYEKKLKDIKKRQRRLERETKILETKYHKYFQRE